MILVYSGLDQNMILVYSGLDQNMILVYSGLDCFIHVSDETYFIVTDHISGIPKKNGWQC